MYEPPINTGDGWDVPKSSPRTTAPMDSLPDHNGSGVLIVLAIILTILISTGISIGVWLHHKGYINVII